METMNGSTIPSPSRHSGKLIVAGALIGLCWTSGAIGQQIFKTPEQAVDALAAAIRAGDSKYIRLILGPGSEQIVSSGDAVQDENMRKLFLAAYDAQHRIETDGDKPATLMIGRDDYPFAIPIAKKGSSWTFDSAAGRREVLVRRIGRNELAAIQVCLAYYDAQNEYAEIPSKEDDAKAYAQRIVSTPGMKDGLYWASSEGQVESPLGEAVAMASLRGYRVGNGEPFHGYYYKILTRQGPKAPGGAHDYIVNGKMIGGFALVAWPAEYGSSGVTTFLVNHDGVVFEKDLGDGTTIIASRMTAFDPDVTWKKVAVETDVEKRN